MLPLSHDSDRDDLEQWVTWDRAHSWHPFTQMEDWVKSEPLFLVEGKGAKLRDVQGRWYLDGNSSIWTNIHGHGHPRLNEAIRDQLSRVAHTSFLGFSNPVATRLTKRLVDIAPGEGILSRVFFSDDGSTAIEVALRQAIQCRLQSGEESRVELIAFEGAYHGDTLGAAALCGVKTFHRAAQNLGYPVHQISDLQALKKLPQEVIKRCTAVIIEPLIQGSAGLRLWPKGMLAELSAWCRQHDVFLILDEVMTGFGRTGKMFACENEDVVPDFLCLAKGFTGGYLPLAATLTTERVYRAFLGGPDKTFYYGHSYCGSALGSAVALASLDLFEEDGVIEKLGPKIEFLAIALRNIQGHPLVHEIRQCGMVAGIELHPRHEGDRRFGAEICLLAREYGLLTRPILNTIVLMPPLCITQDEIQLMVDAIEKALSVSQVSL